MRTKMFAIAVVAATVLPLSAHGQNLFRTGRPDYARTPTNVAPYPSYQDTRSFADRYGEAIGRRPSFGNLSQPDLDYQRLQAAWDGYRREAIRYQNRYQAAYTPAGYANQNWTAADQSTRPSRCECRERVFQGTPADYPPTLNSAPRRSESVNFSGYDHRYSDPARTASRPVVDLFKSLLPTQ